MKKISDLEFANFLTLTPLYSKINAVEDLTGNATAFLDHHDFMGKAFNFLCPSEKTQQTFKTVFGQKGGYLPLSEMIRTNPDKLPYTFSEQTRKLDLTLHISGVCQSCKHEINFLIRATSDKTWDERRDGLIIYLQKVGQYPAIEVRLDRTLTKYLSEEDQTTYMRGLMCLSISYGIGAYAYFRRVIENEIKRIVADIASLEFNGSNSVKEALSVYEKDSQMGKLIDVVNKHLPESFNQLGDNPIRLLYEQLSVGIHNLSEDECVKRAQSIDIIFKYVVRKINEEKYQLADVKAALKNLRSTNPK